MDLSGIRYVEHRGCLLALRVRGEGTPVVLIQGIAIHGDGWMPQVDGLMAHHRCLTFDNRGMGRSQPAGTVTVEQMADDVRHLMDTVGFEKAHVVGHSLGGLVALEVARIARERVLSLALLCTFADGLDAAPLSARMMWSGMRTRIGTKRMRRQAFLELVMPLSALRGVDREMLARKMEPLFGHDLGMQPSVTRAQLAALRGHDASAGLASLEGLPTLVVSAEQDPISPPDLGHALAAAIPGARYVEIPDASHGVTIQRADQVNALLAEHFLAVDLS